MLQKSSINRDIFCLSSSALLYVLESNSVNGYFFSRTIIKARANRSVAHRDTRQSSLANHREPSGQAAQAHESWPRGHDGVRPRKRSHPIYYIQDHCTALLRARMTSARASDELFARAIDCRDLIDLPVS